MCLGLFLSMEASAQPYNYTATISLNNQFADGTAADVLTVYVTYASGPNAGQPANNVTVDFLLLPSTASNPTTTGPASGFANGTVVFPVSNTVAGPQPVKIIVNGVSEIINLNFVPAPVNNNPGPNPSFYTTIIGSATYASPVNTADTTVVQVHATDGTNNELPGTPVEFMVVGGSAQNTAYFNGTSVAYNTPYVVPGGLGQNGSLDLPIANTKPGTVQVEALVWNGSSWIQIGTPQTVTFVIPPPTNNPPPGSSNPSYYTTIIATATADNTDTAVVRLHITDGTTDEPDGYPVEFTITANTTGANATMSGTATGPAPQTVTGTVGTSLKTILAANANGSIDIPIKDPNVGSVTIAAYAYNPATGQYDIAFGTETVTFVAGPPTNNPPPGSPNPSYYITVIPQAAANNSDTAVVQVHVTDGTNNEGPGTVIRWTIVGGSGGAENNASLNNTAVLPNHPYLAPTGLGQNGSLDLPITSPKPGTVQIEVEVWNGSSWVEIGTPQTVTFVVPPPTNNPPPGSPNPSYYITIIPQATADNTDTAVVQLHITDGTNNEPDGYKVEFTITANTTLGNPTMTGTAPSTATGSVNTSLQTVLATNANGSIDIPITDPKVGSVTIAAFAYNPATGNYDIPFGTQTVNFVAGKPVTGDPGGPSDGGDPGGGSPGNGGTPPSGGGGSSGSGGDPGTNNGYTEIYVLSQYNYRLADGQQQDSVYAYITDANKNPVSGVAVTFYIQQPGGTITSGEQWTTGQTTSPITAITGPDGIARVAMTSTTPGSVWVYATIIDPTTGNPALIAKSDVELDFVTKPDVTNIQTALTVIVGEALADGTQQNVVKAHVVDLDGNVMSNQQIYFAIDSGTGTIVTPQPVTTDANGDAFIQITGKTVGYVLITATVDSEKIVFGSPARVYFAMINIYVPRAFSPNNDGTNDLLKPILVGISTFHYFNVYNRWGNLIFTTQDPNQGWDGTFKGVPQPVETYLWIAEGIDENGHKVVQKGMTSLVR